MADDIEIDTGSPKLTLRIDAGVGVLTLNDPENRNPLGGDLRPLFRKIVERIARDNDIRCLLLTGAGQAFCAGGSAKAMASIEPEPLEARIRTIQWESEASAILHEMPKPSIAALPGAAAGAGLSLALACDLRIAAERAFMITSFKRLALPGDYGGTWLLTQLVGPAKARELYFFSPRIQSQECLALGLVNRVVPDEQLHDEAMKWARELADGPAAAFRWMKENFNRAQHTDLRTTIAEEAQRQCWAAETEDYREATRAFAEKRSPEFRKVGDTP